MIINILSVTYYTFTGIVFIFILLGIIGKFGFFPLNLGIFGIVDGIIICKLGSIGTK
jgi:divalent metal cation (Fe/Co/Zn/Cd) transporter